MATWYTSSDTVILDPAPAWAHDIVIVVEPGIGSVQVQYEDSTPAWFTPAEPDFTLTSKGPVVWSRANSPRLKITATDDAKFQVFAG